MTEIYNKTDSSGYWAQNVHRDQGRIEILWTWILWSLADFTVENTELLFNFSVRKSSVDYFQCVFWTFLLLEIKLNFRILRSASTSDIFVENVAF